MLTVNKEDMHARAVMQKIGELYAVEKEARELGLYADARRELRRSKSLPLLEPLRELILSARDKATPKSNLGKACQYALKLWGRLLLIFEDGRIEIDNNMAENAMRPVALGRKNWLHVGSEKAGRSWRRWPRWWKRASGTGLMFGTICSMCFPGWPTGPHTASTN